MYIFAYIFTDPLKIVGIFMVFMYGNILSHMGLFGY